MAKKSNKHAGGANLFKGRVGDGIQNFVSRVGLNNNNNLSASFYAFNLITKNRIALEAAYRGSWFVGQVIDCMAEDMTRAGITIQTGEKDFDGKVIQREMVNLQIWNSLKNSISWGRLYGGAISVLQIDGQDLSSPLRPDTVSKGQFKGIVTYDRWMLNPTLNHLIDTGPDMGLPEYYQLVNDPRMTQPGFNTATGELTVHHSRIIRHIGIQLPYFQAIVEMMWGESELERMWDRMITYDTATMSAANLIERASNRVISVENLREVLAAGGKPQANLEQWFAMIREFQTNEGLTIIDKNDDFQAYNYTFSGLDNLLLQFGQQLSGASGIPLVRLFGQSPAGLSATGDSDIRMYYDKVNSKQNADLRGGMNKILSVLWPSVFGVPVPDDMHFDFVPLWQMSALDKSTVAKTNTETILGAYDSGVITAERALEEMRDASGESGLFSNITDADIAEAKKNALENPPLAEGEEPPSGEPNHKKTDQKVPQIDSAWDKFKKWASR